MYRKIHQACVVVVVVTTATTAAITAAAKNGETRLKLTLFWPTCQNNLGGILALVTLT